ncbi:ion channel [Aurantivibrio plasticivorans]
MTIIFIFSLAIIMIAVLIHYEVLSLLSRALPRFNCQRRILVLIGVIGALIAHVLEVILFGLTYYVLIRWWDVGTLAGNLDGTVFDCVYFSFTTFTTLGFGDIEPDGYIRMLVGLEALTGLVLITWSASFMFIEMQKFWQR